jgi:hypothetical protein
MLQVRHGRYADDAYLLLLGLLRGTEDLKQGARIAPPADHRASGTAAYICWRFR